MISQTVIGGAESFGFGLSAELARRGHEVLLLANRKNGELFARPRPEGLNLAELDRKNRRDPRILGFLVGSIRRFRPDVIHSHNFEANTWARSLGLLFPGIPVFCHEHSGSKSEQPIHRYWMDRLLFARCSGVFAVSESVRAVLETKHHVPARKLSLIRNGIDLERFAPPAEARRDPLAAVCVANLSEIKNHRLLLKAWREVHTALPEASLTLVGDGALRPELEQQARSSGLGESVRFVGVQSDVRPYLWSSSVFVLSSRWEAMPLSVMEAMACGLACVVPAVGGLPEIVTDGRTGRLVPPQDAPALACALRELLEGSELARGMGNRAAEHAARTYGMGACAEQIEQWYLAALRARRH